MAGFYGKLPAKGDFLTRRLPRDFVDSWDGWLQAGMNDSRQALGDEWLQIYLTSPLWRFALPPGVCGDHAWAGVLMPSMDKVGRYFPMTVTTELETPVVPILVAGKPNPWFEAIENCLLEALDNEALDIDQFDEVLQACDFDQSGQNGSGRMVDFDQGARSSLGDDLNIATALMDTMVEMLRDPLDSCSVWWGQGSERISPSFVMCRGLPGPGKFTAMLDGRWSEHGWSDGEAAQQNSPGVLADSAAG